MDEAVKDLESIGYGVHSSILNAAQFGVPQARKRLFLVCFHKDLGIDHFEFPKPLDKLVPLRSIVESGPHTANREISDSNIPFRDVEQALIAAKANPFVPIRVDDLGKTYQGQRIFHSDGPAATQIAFCGGTGAYLIGDKVRSLTVRELLSCFGYPESFRIPFLNQKAERLLGNSVPVPVVGAVMQQIQKALAKQQNPNNRRPNS